MWFETDELMVELVCWKIYEKSGGGVWGSFRLEFGELYQEFFVRGGFRSDD